MNTGLHTTQPLYRLLTSDICGCSETSSHCDCVVRSLTKASKGPRCKPRRNQGGMMGCCRTSYVNVRGRDRMWEGEKNQQQRGRKTKLDEGNQRECAVFRGHIVAWNIKKKKRSILCLGSSDAHHLMIHEQARQKQPPPEYQTHPERHNNISRASVTLV